MKKLIFIVFLLSGCQSSPELYCSEGLYQPDGLHIYYSEYTETEDAVVDFTPEPNKYYEFYVVLLSECSKGFCVEDYKLGKLIRDDSYYLENGCHVSF